MWYIVPNLVFILSTRFFCVGRGIAVANMRMESALGLRVGACEMYSSSKNVLECT